MTTKSFIKTLERTFRSHLGNQFMDGDKKIESWQLVDSETGKAFATLDLEDGVPTHYLCADSIALIGKAWREKVLIASRYALHIKPV